MAWLEALLTDFPRSGVGGGGELLVLMARINVNVFDGGLCPALALTNHSCRPNCGVAFHLQPPEVATGGHQEAEAAEGERSDTDDEAAAAVPLCTFELRLLDAVPADTEMTISYLGGALQFRPAAQRRAMLSRWGKTGHSLSLDVPSACLPGRTVPEVLLPSGWLAVDARARGGLAG